MDYNKTPPELRLNGYDLEDVYEKYFKDKVCKPETSKEQNLPLLNVSTNQADEIAPGADDVWIFGYGSLVWKADFPYIDRRRGFICGFKRCFYQNSIDHRGTHSKPGRVVTLLHTDVDQDRVYGVAYRIAEQHKCDVLQHLDYREKNGYERCTLKFHEFPETSGICFDIIMYIATKDNESYAGDVWQLPSIADQIFSSAGPSGPNREYLFKLAQAMRMLFPGVEDEHLFNLETEVLKRIENDEPAILERVLKKDIATILSHKIRKTEAEMQLEALRIYCEAPGWKETLLARGLTQNQNS